MRVGWVVAALMALGAAGCTDTADLVASNPRAQAAGGSARMIFTRGMPGGPMKIVMASGETLPGSFSIDETAASMAPGGPGNFAATARGPTTQLVCHGRMVAGHGSADCVGQDGATYRMAL